MLCDLYVMKIDAKQELDNFNSVNQITQFMDAIIIPNGVNIDYLLDGERFFLTGNKGAGKTALLIYTALRAEKLFNAEKSFMIFKDISQEEREDYKNIAHVTKYDQDSIQPYYDYEFVWKWLIHKNIAEAINNSEKEIFINDKNLIIYLNAINAVKTSQCNGKIPFIGKDGYIELNIAAPPYASIKGRINFDFKKNTSNQIKFSTHITELNKLFQNLSAGDSQLYVIIDELNLSIKNIVEFERDVTMIRDLIITIENFNMQSRKSHDNLRIISGIRNEVINSIQSLGKEVNKAIESYGIPIDWTIHDQDKSYHPLIKVLVNYLRVTDMLLNDKKNRTDKEVYQKWVSDKMFGRLSEEIILSNTLYRPRHVVRLLNLAKLTCPYHSHITEETIRKTRKEYSKQCWIEVVEELSVIYDADQITAIKNLFAGSKSRTTRRELYAKASETWSSNSHLISLLKGFDDLLRVLYKTGIIGNCRYAERMYYRWYFRGDETLLLDQDIIVHRLFWPVFTIVSRNRVF